MTAPDNFWRHFKPVFVLSSRDAQKVGGEWAGEKKQTTTKDLGKSKQRQPNSGPSVGGLL